MYYVGDADGDNDTNCRARSRSQQHTGMTCYDEARRCPTVLSAECVVMVALWGDIYIKTHVEQHLGNRNIGQLEVAKVNLGQIKATRQDDQQANKTFIKLQITYIRVFTQRLHPQHSRGGK